MGMLTVRLRGGLGNQMFQYALGRSLAEKYQRKRFLVSDQLRGKGFPDRREYSLHILKIRAELTTAETITSMSGISVHVAERGFDFHPEVFDCLPVFHIVLEGFWQSELYFKDIENIIRSEFLFASDDYDYENPDLPTLIQSSNSVCVHVRRGDYLTGNGSLDFIGLEYYAAAVHAVLSRIPNPHFFVFSDDIEWCKANMHCTQPHTFVTHQRSPTQNTQENLRLMRLCKHFVIANSTFSWWAAWLGSAPETVVIAPGRWFRSTPRPKGLFPETC